MVVTLRPLLGVGVDLGILGEKFGGGFDGCLCGYIIIAVYRYGDLFFD
jgi:hypothetical protein